MLLVLKRTVVDLAVALLLYCLWIKCWKGLIASFWGFMEKIWIDWLVCGRNHRELSNGPLCSRTRPSELRLLGEKPVSKCIFNRVGLRVERTTYSEPQWKDWHNGFQPWRFLFASSWLNGCATRWRELIGVMSRCRGQGSDSPLLRKPWLQTTLTSHFSKPSASRRIDNAPHLGSERHGTEMNRSRQSEDIYIQDGSSQADNLSSSTSIDYVSIM